MDVVEDAANICNYNDTDNYESDYDNMDDENTRDCPIGVEVFLLLLLLFHA